MPMISSVKSIFTLGRQYLIICLVGGLQIVFGLMVAQAGSMQQNRYSFTEGKLSIPSVEVDIDEIYHAELSRIGAHGFQFTLDELFPLQPILPYTASYDVGSEILLLQNVATTDPQEGIRQYRVTMQHIPYSTPFRLMVMQAYTLQGDLAYSSGLGEEQGTLRITDMETFMNYTELSDLPGAVGVQELKFLLTAIDNEYPTLYLQNSKNFPLHFDFAREILGWYAGLSDNDALARFNAETYFSDRRQHLAGSIIYYANYQPEGDQQKQGIFTLELWPTDPVSPKLISRAYQIIAAALPVSRERLAYHPVSETHVNLYLARQQEFANASIHTIMSDDLLAQTDSAQLNTGEAYGRLRIVSPGDPVPTEKDIVIFTYIPNTLNHVAGIITDTPQTPLSHINVKARQNGTPNAYIKSAGSDPMIAQLIGQWVHYQVGREGVSLTAATQQQAEAWLEAVRPNEEQITESDLTETEPLPLTAIGFNDWRAFGVKAANVAELGKILAPGVAPDGYAIPFALYDEFMQLPRCGKQLRELCDSGENGDSFYRQAQEMLLDTGFQTDPEIRAEHLEAFRDAIEEAEAPADMISMLEAIRYFWEPQGPPFNQSLRTRSSTNNEDLPGFNGAGLYQSYTHKQDEGNLINSVKQVWASLWTDRAYDERRFHRIDHFKVYMGVLVHPNYGDEQVNGVAITKNIYNPHWPGFYVNSQYGEISITNPEPIETEHGTLTPIPEEFVMTRLPAAQSNLEWEVQYIRHSNVETVYDQPVATENTLTDLEMVELRDAMQTIQDHFKRLYQGDEDFALELEFKITETSDGSRGRLAIKQARPWID